MTRTTSLLFLIGLVIIASLGLYRTSNQVQELDRQLHSLNAAIEGERQNMHVLKAEWVYLANPARVEAAAKKHLDLRPTAPKQIASLNTFSDLLPNRNEAAALAATAATVSAKPIASIRSTLKTTIAALPAKAAAVVAFVEHKHSRPATTLAAAETGYVTDHIAIQQTASAQPLPSGVGLILDRLNTGTR